MKVRPNQLVVALTPVVFAPLAGAMSVFAAKQAGVHIDASSLQAVFIAGATIATAKAALWLRGWQAYEKRATVPAVPSDETAGSEAVSAPAHVNGSAGDAHAGEIDLAGDEFDDSDLDAFLGDDLAGEDDPVPAGAVA